MKKNTRLILTLAVVAVAFVVVLVVVLNTRRHTVTFQDYDGRVIVEETVKHGETATSPRDPIREGYDFVGWDKELTNITSDLVITAQYTIRSYTVVFEDYDGTRIKVETVAHGAAVPSPATPSREGYNFIGWDTDLSNVTSDVNVRALYDIKTHTVRFVDYDGTELKLETVEHGSAATAPEDPEIPGHEFAGWSLDFSDVTMDMEIKAQYEIKRHSVVFVDHDGVELKTESVGYGRSATAPRVPTREGFDFVGWDEDFSSVTSDLHVTAQYRPRTYSVHFKDHDETDLEVRKAGHGDDVSAPEIPEREGYRFLGWDKDFTNITSDLVVTAQYAIKNYTVIFEDYDGTELKVEIVAHGADATAPEAPHRESYDFVGWDRDFSNVTSPVVVKALYEISAYSVVFEDYDGTELKTETVQQGAAATAPEEPTRWSYDFVGWDTDYTSVTSDLVIKAQYEVKTYTVVFEDHDGTELKAETVQHAKAATAPGVPEREGYNFVGWSTDFSSVSSDITVKALYRLKAYSVVFEDYDGTKLKTETVQHGAAATVPEEPTRWSYDFVGWDTDYTSVTSDLVIKAQYEVKTYTVVFEDHDGTELKAETVQHAKAATAPEVPEREGYNFVGWSTDFSSVSSDITVKALYRLKAYSVVFEDYDGTKLRTETVEHGKAATAPEPPEREGYNLSGWDKDFTNITSDLVVTAQYAIKNYTVIFEDYDGTELKVEIVAHGADATAPEAPHREGYDFVRWDRDFSNVTSPVVVKALYEISAYSVVFEDYDGTKLKTETVQHGAAATAPEEPTRWSYDFVGWDTDYTSVTSALVVKAQYEVKTYTVVFEDHDGTELKVETVQHGKVATAPEVPEREGYNFVGWSTDFSSVSSDITVKALYRLKAYSVVFKDYDGTKLKTETVEHGKAATAPESPEREGYSFVGWDTDFSSVSSDISVEALYTPAMYSVVFVDHDGTELEIQTVGHGETATAPESPEREGYNFLGWDADFSFVTSDTVVRAEYEIVEYTVFFEDFDGRGLKLAVVGHGQPATPPAPPERTGFEFIGWDTDFSVVTSHMVVTAQYEAIEP